MYPRTVGTAVVVSVKSNYGVVALQRDRTAPGCLGCIRRAVGVSARRREGKLGDLRGWQVILTKIPVEAIAPMTMTKPVAWIVPRPLTQEESFP